VAAVSRPVRTAGGASRRAGAAQGGGCASPRARPLRRRGPGTGRSCRVASSSRSNPSMGISVNYCGDLPIQVRLHKLPILVANASYSARAAKREVRVLARGRPRHRPHRVQGDRGYDSEPQRQELRALGITPVLAKRSTDHGSGLGIYRWVVERILAWLPQWRRLRVRYERRADIHEAFLTLGCALICWRYLL
jgi:transposase